jgi:hypothetical protein
MDVIQHSSDIDYNVLIVDEEVDSNELERFLAGSSDGLRLVIDSECNAVCVASKAVAEWLVRLINAHKQFQR